MAKIVLDDVAGGYNLANINSNFQRIEDELNNKVLYRDPEGEPNTLDADLDANGKNIYNVASLSANTVIVDGIDIADQVQQAVDAAASAAHIYAGVYTSDPTTRPDGSPIQDGDLYFNSISELTFRFNDGSWIASDIDASALAAPTGAGLVGHSATVVYSPGTVGAVLNDTCINVKMYPWLAVGNGIADDYPAVQAALNAGAGKTVRFPEGTYRMGSGTLLISSNTTVIGEPGAVIVQPNKGQFAGFATSPGVRNVTIMGLDIRGPWYGTGPGNWNDKITPGTLLGGTTVDGDTWEFDMAENLGIDIRGRWYQRETLGLDQAALDALTDFNVEIKISGCRIDGFGQSACHADNITNFWFTDNQLFNCGRDGLRMYGVFRGVVRGNTVGNMSPGKHGAYPNWNVYGITATRMLGEPGAVDTNSTIARPSEDILIEGNHVYNCHTWKSLDTHGGINIRFIGNHCLNSYIGIGGDQAGTNTTHGINPVRGMLVADNILEFNGGQYMRAGMTLYGNNSTNQAMVDVTVTGNIIKGYGGNDTDGAISLSNVRRCTVVGNTIKDAPRSAVCLDNTVEDVIVTNNVINDPRSFITVVANALGSGYTLNNTVCNVSGGGGTGLVVIPNIDAGQITTYSVVNPGTGYTSAPTVTVVGDGTGATTTVIFNAGFGVLVQTATAKAMVGNNAIRNETQALLRDISLTRPSSGYGVRVEPNDVSGTTLFSTSANGRPSRVMARVTSTGVFSTNRGFVSVFKSATGVYEMVLPWAMVTTADMVPVAQTYATAGHARASLYGANAKALDYDAQTGNFTLGSTLTGGTSGATGIIISDTDIGTTGTLVLKTISGVFQDNETITDGATGSAKVNGILYATEALSVTTTNTADVAADISFVIVVEDINP